MRYMRILAAALEHPWAVTDEVYHSILAVLVRCEAGERLSAEEIREAVGERKERVKPMLAFADGLRLQEDFLAGSVAAMWQAASGNSSKSAPGAIAVLPVHGIIAPRASNLDTSEGGTSIDTLTRQFRTAMADPGVKGVILDIDSPGGSVHGVNELAGEIRAARDQKPVVAQVNHLAASAAYYLGSQAGEMVMAPSGEVGSIGVKTMHADVSEALRQKGVRITNIAFGKHKNEGNPYEPLSPDAREFMQSRVNDYGEAFVNAVAAGRRVTPDVVREQFGQGRVFGAKQAKAVGMVDRIGTMDDTVQRMFSGTGGARPRMEGSMSQCSCSPMGNLDGRQVFALDPACRIHAAASGPRQDTKRVDGKDCTKSCFAYRPDDNHENWKLPIESPDNDEEWEKNHIRNALARFDQTDMPDAEEKAKARSRVDAAAKKYGIGEDNKKDSLAGGVTTASAENKEVAMSTTAAETAAAAAAVTQERDRVATITQLATLHHQKAEQLTKWLAGGVSVEAVRTEILDSLAVTATRDAARITPYDGGMPRGVQVVGDEADKLPKGARFGRAVRCAAMSLRSGRQNSPAKIARDVMRDSALAQSFEAATDPQLASNFSEGGFIIPPNLMPEVIELLRPIAVVRSLNPTEAPLINGTLALPKLTSGTTFNYVGEAQQIPATKVGGGNVKASAKKLAGLVPLSNDVLRFASIAADSMVRDDMVRALAQAEDIAFIRSLGTQYSPKGLRYWSSNVFNSTLTQAEINDDTDLEILKYVQQDIANLELVLRRTNRPPMRQGFIMSPRSEFFLKWQVRDGYGNNPFRAEMQTGMFIGRPYRVTTQIPENLSVVGSGIDSEIYLAEFADVVVCDAPTIAVEVSNEASYQDPSGTWQFCLPAGPDAHPHDRGA